MSLKYIRDYYRVPAHRGAIVMVEGKRGKVTSASHHLRIRFDGDNLSTGFHPKDERIVWVNNDEDKHR